MVLLLTSSAFAQDSVPREQWRIDGLVQLGKRSGPQPVANQWVVVHRITSDGSGKVIGEALDSGATDARGRYSVRYPHFGSPEATYIGITTYKGISYITAPLTRPRISEDDAAIIVFDTTSPPYPIHVAGRHVIITSPDSGDRRRVIEVYELMNDSTYTVTGTENNPVWSAPIPDGVSDLVINPTGDISPTMTKVVPGALRVFASISPGLRQVSYTYTLGTDAFPLTMTVADSASVFELLLQEQAAAVEGGGFTEVAPVSQEGVMYRRFLAQNVPAHAVLKFTMPRSVSRVGRQGVRIVAWTLSIAMLLALGLVFWRRRAPRRVVAIPGVSSDVESLVREIATLDAEFERSGDQTDAARAEFDVKRSDLKARLNAALAVPDRRT